MFSCIYLERTTSKHLRCGKGFQTIKKKNFPHIEETSNFQDKDKLNNQFLLLKEF